WICQFLLRYAHAGHNMQQAIDAPAWHTEHFPASFWPRAARPGVVVVESRVGEATIAELRRRGHIVEVGPAWSEGRLTAASRGGVRRKAAANRRGMQGYAARRYAHAIVDLPPPLLALRRDGKFRRELGTT